MGLLIAFLFLSGCKNNTVVVKPENLSFDFEISHGGSSFLINAEVDIGGEMEFTVLSPENIKGLSFEFSDSTVHTEFMELEKDFPINDTDFGVLGRLYNAFFAVSGAEAVRQGDKLVTTVGDDEFVFTVTDLGLPIAVSFDGNEIEFKNITAH